MDASIEAKGESAKIQLVYTPNTRPMHVKPLTEKPKPANPESRKPSITYHDTNTATIEYKVIY